MRKSKNAMFYSTSGYIHEQRIDKRERQQRELSNVWYGQAPFPQFQCWRICQCVIRRTNSTLKLRERAGNEHTTMSMPRYMGLIPWAMLTTLRWGELGFSNTKNINIRFAFIFPGMDSIFLKLFNMEWIVLSHAIASHLCFLLSLKPHRRMHAKARLHCTLSRLSTKSM